MLKALELRGFKSFADKTPFDFPQGITVVVGPNGSGKSNIVDAIRWVLGEQSAKSLRGKEMSDVIFKGAGAGGRKMANTAEATIIFDNTEGKLDIEAPEVHVTRRVYRSGEGEYLINRQPCRLRDLKDLFRGTGVGTDAYSLIEQGKVDTLLQASPRDRRAIFEEAAGISRFKAKKVEAQRRLERVAQNLLRLSDIVEEVDNRLRTIRSQATKARRYREYTGRLQQLRTHVGRVDWRRLTESLLAVEAARKQLVQEADNLSTQEESLEARSLEFETEIGLAGEMLRACEARLARNRERISAGEAAAAREGERLRDLDEEAARYRRQLLAMCTRAGGLEGELRTVTGELDDAQEQFQQLSQQVAKHEDAVRELTIRLDQLRGESERQRTEYVDQMRATADLSSKISANESEIDAAESNVARTTETLDRWQSQLGDTEEKLQTLATEETRLAEQVRHGRDALEQAQVALQRDRNQLQTQQDQLAELKGRQTGCRERADVLQQLEARLEGVSAGVKDVLSRARDDPDGPFAGVRGLVADLIRVSVETARMVDVALGDRAQHLVFAGTRLLEYLQSDQCRLAGRVGFLPLASSAPRGEAYRVNPDSQPGVIGRADRFVEAAQEYHLLLQGLLGNTWLVESLSDAVRLSGTTARGVRFVTRAGELLDADGRLLAGPSQAAAGLVSRRSQQRALRTEIERLDQQIDQLQQTGEQLRQAIKTREQQVQQLSVAHNTAATALSEQRMQMKTAQERRQQLQQQQTVSREELRELQNKQATAAKRLEAAGSQRNRLESSLSLLDQQIQGLEKQIQQMDSRRQAAGQEATAVRVELAKREQRLDSLRTQLTQLQRDQEERSRALHETHAQSRQCDGRRREVQRTILRTTSAIAELYLQQEADAKQSVVIDQQRDVLQQDRVVLGREIQQVRRKLRDVEEQQHRKLLEESKASHERDALAQRLREDYQIELSELEDEPDEEEQREREAIDTEIVELRRKISNIGAVNLDALNELEDLECRHDALHRQYRDLVEAKESLERVIHRINADSRRLFTETLEAIRTNFQELFRRVFGGGRADIQLEEGIDILESCIDIIATPPGKSSLNLSLLSGGERALTAVTLLLAIFQYRPSPFCVLDEVDGPLDEANIGRFIDVLVGFLDWTKFVVVTHSKKTMTAANTLYGITMQESGVSKRVSVQFEDVSEDGHIRPEAVKREQESSLSSDGDGRGAA